jgi:hypothetical protein
MSRTSALPFRVRPDRFRPVIQVHAGQQGVMVAEPTGAPVGCEVTARGVRWAPP